MSSWSIHFTNHALEMKATYKVGIFKKLERIAGTLPDHKKKVWDSMMLAIPHKEKDMDQMIEQFRGKVVYKHLSKSVQTVYSQCLSYYMNWYEQQSGGISYRMDGAAGRHLKQTIAFLTKECGTEEKVVETFTAVLSAWDQLPKFYQEQKDLKQINGNLNTILRALKTGSNEQQKNKNQRDSALERLRGDAN